MGFFASSVGAWERSTGSVRLDLYLIIAACLDGPELARHGPPRVALCRSLFVRLGELSAVADARIRSTLTSCVERFRDRSRKR
jgi:hypothetical protein